MDYVTPPEKTLKQRWTEADNDRSTQLRLAEEFASYTLPSMFPTQNVTDVVLQNMMDPIGARGTNHLSNKVVSTLFQPQAPFFRLTPDAEARKALQALTGEENKAKAAELMEKIDTELAEVERAAIEHLDFVTYRPAATMAAKLLIMTGNAMMDHHNPNKPVQCYNLRNYVVWRDCDGEVIAFMTKQTKAYNTFSKEVQEKLKEWKTNYQYAPYNDKSEVTIYTYVELKEDGKFHLSQAADEVKLNSAGNWTKQSLPWIILTWNLVQGEDYGRGLVEEYSGAFHALKVLYQSLINLAGIIADLKFLVKPASLVDVAELNKSPPGSYHSGNPEDVTAIETNKQHDAQFILTMIERYEKQISDAFLLMSTRDAERVTTEEIRRDAQELEMSNGGIYSRLASTWQLPTAYIALEQSGFDGSALKNIKPKIVTGMDTLSRQSELDNVRQLFADMALTETIPEELRAAFDPIKFVMYLGKARQVDVNKFLKSPEQMQAEQQAAMEQNQQLTDQATDSAVKVEGAKAMAKEPTQ